MSASPTEIMATVHKKEKHELLQQNLDIKKVLSLTNGDPEFGITS